MNQKNYFVIFSMLLLILLAACTTQKGTIKIGVLTPLSGPAAFIGNSYVAGLETAANEINAAGGINGRQIQILLEDNKNTAADGITAYQKLMLSEPDLLISTTSAASVAISPLAKEIKIPVLFSVVFADILSANPNAVTFFPTAKEDAKTTVVDMTKNGVKTVGVLYLNSEYGKASFDAFKADAEAHKITIVASEAFAGDQADFSTPYLKVKEQIPDAVYVVAINAIPALNYIKTQSDAPQIYTNLVPVFGGLPAKSPVTFEGVHMTTSKVSLMGTAENTAFVAKIANPNAGVGYASIGYDNMNAIAAVLGKESDASKFVATFSSFGKLTGVNGEFDLNGREVSMGLVPTVG